MSNIKKMTPSPRSSRVIKYKRCHNTKKLPPFGKKLKNRLTGGEPISSGITVFVGEPSRLDERIKRCWFFGKPVLLFPVYEDVEAYRWDLVAGYEVDVFDYCATPKALVKRLALALLKAGSPCVRYIGLKSDFIKFTGGGYGTS